MVSSPPLRHYWRVQSSQRYQSIFINHRQFSHVWPVFCDNDRYHVAVIQCSSKRVCGALPSAVNRLHGTRAFQWHQMLRTSRKQKPIPAQPYQKQHTWKAMWSGVTSVFTSHSASSPASSDMQRTPRGFVPHAYQPSSTSLPPPNPP